MSSEILERYEGKWEGTDVSEVSQHSRAVANANGARWYSLKETSGSAKQVNPTRSINFRDRYIYGGLSNSDADDISQIAEC